MTELDGWTMGSHSRCLSKGGIMDSEKYLGY